MEQRLTFRRGEWTRGETTLSLEECLCFNATLGGGTTAPLTELDGGRPLREVVDELAAARRSTATRSRATRSEPSAACSAPGSSSAAREWLRAVAEPPAERAVA
jgi:hypothetical protein